MSNTLVDLVRDQVLAEGPDIASMSNYVSQRAYDEACEEYVDLAIDLMPHTELLQRISDALEAYLPELGVRLGL